MYLTQTSILKNVGVLKENLKFASFKLPLNSEKNKLKDKMKGDSLECTQNYTLLVFD